MKFDGQYYRALLGTLFMMLLIGLASLLVGTQEILSFMWFLGVINIICTFTLMLYINYKFIVFTEEQVSHNNNIKQQIKEVSKNGTDTRS